MHHCVADLISNDKPGPVILTALFTILSYLLVCYFHFKVKEGLVFPKAYLTPLTTLAHLIEIKSTSSNEPCTSQNLVFQVRFHLPTPVTDCIGSRSVFAPVKGRFSLVTEEIFCKIISTSLLCLGKKKRGGGIS